MAGKLFTLPQQVLLDNSGTVPSLLPGAKAYFWINGTSTPQDTYTDSLLTTAHSNPVVADGDGQFPPIYLDNSKRYKVTFKDANDVDIPVGDDDFTQPETFTIPDVKAEDDASVTPVNGNYLPGYIERFGGNADGSTDSTAALELAASVGRQNILFWDTGSTLTLNDFSRAYIIRDAFIDRTSLIGPAAITSDGTQTLSMLRLGQDPDTANGYQWRTRRVQDITFIGKTRVDTAISFGGEDGTLSQYANSWTIDGCFFERCHIGIRKDEGNFGNRIIDCSSSNGNYGYVAFGRPEASIAHLGNDKIEGGEWSGHKKYAFYLDGEQVGGTGDTYFRNVIVEGNAGGGIFIKDYNNAYTPLRLDNVWFENNMTAGGTVDLSDIGGSASHTPRDLYLENVDHCIVKGSQLREIETKDSNLICEFCSLESGGAKFYDTSTGAANYVRMRNVHITNWGDELVGAGLVVVESLDRVSSVAGGAANRMWLCPPRIPYGGNGVTNGTVLESTTFQEGNDWQAVATTDISRDGYVEGLTFPTAAQYTFTASDEFLGPSESAAPSTTVGKWYVCTIEARLDSGDANIDSFKFGGGYNHTRGDAEELLKTNTGKWVTLANVAELSAGTGSCRPVVTTNSGGTVQMSFGACQIVEFDNAQEAYDYYNGRYFAVNTGKAERVKQDSLPTRANDATPSADPDLSDWILDADTVYIVEGSLVVDTDATADIQLELSFSQTPQDINIGYIAYALSVAAARQTAESAVSINGEAGDQTVSIEGTFKTNATTGGTVDLDWAQGTSNAYATNLFEGSWLRIHKAYNPS